MYFLFIHFGHHISWKHEIRKWKQNLLRKSMCWSYQNESKNRNYNFFVMGGSLLTLLSFFYFEKKSNKRLFLWLRNFHKIRKFAKWQFCRELPMKWIDLMSWENKFLIIIHSSQNISFCMLSCWSTQSKHAVSWVQSDSRCLGETLWVWPLDDVM